MNVALGPITNVCIISDRRNCPPQYILLDRTADGEEADLWKDGYFGSKTRRYICFTRDNRPHINQLNQVVTDLALVGSKESIPPGYTAMRETVDSREPVLKKHVICVRYIVKHNTSSAIVDITLAKDDSYKAMMYTLVGEVNGINLTFKLSPITNVASRPAPPPPRMATEVPLHAPPPNHPQNAAPSNHTQPTYGNVQRSTSVNAPHTGIEGVPFKLHERLTKSLDETPTDPLPQITIKTASQLAESTAYDFSRDKEIMNGLN